MTSKSLGLLKSQLIDIAKNAPDIKEEREQLLEAAKNSILALERPKDVIEQVCYQVKNHPTSLNAAV
jgi:hypothetical protein